MKLGLPLVKNVFQPLAKSVLIPLGLTAAPSAADAGIHKKNSWFGNDKITVALSLSKKISLTCFKESPLKNDKKCFLFHLKSSFRYRDI